MLRFPRVLPAPWYRDPALREVGLGLGGENAVAAAVAKPHAVLRVPKDRYYTAARRVVVRDSVRKRLADGGGRG